MKKHHRICKLCGGPIRKTHRWRQVWKRFLWLTWMHYEHLNCREPELGPANPRDPREVPLPFDELKLHDGVDAEHNLGGDVYPTYGGIERVL
jgi:hypothetical protein